ncbi:MAG: hypothetical protein ACLVBJ_10200 [Pilosibacter sp.]
MNIQARKSESEEVKQAFGKHRKSPEHRLHQRDPHGK